LRVEMLAVVRLKRETQGSTLLAETAAWSTGNLRIAGEAWAPIPDPRSDECPAL